MESLVTTEWLAGEMAASDLRIVDASYFLPAMERDAAAEYQAAHIPGAVFLDLAALVDKNASFDNTLPPAELFASRMQTLGLGDGSRVVLYDDSPLKSAARGWFMFRLFGTHSVAVLDGGLAKWRAEGRALEQGTKNLRHRHFTAWSDPKRLRSKADVLANLSTQQEQVVDARGSSRFSGTEVETRPGLASGHIPGSCNVPYSTLFQADGTYKTKAEIRTVFESAGLDLTRPIVTSCGSGMTACVLIFALHLICKTDTALYDGSWSEWGSDPALPKALATV